MSSLNLLVASFSFSVISSDVTFGSRILMKVSYFLFNRVFIPHIVFTFSFPKGLLRKHVFCWKFTVHAGLSLVGRAAIPDVFGDDLLLMLLVLEGGGGECCWLSIVTVDGDFKVGV